MSFNIEDVRKQASISATADVQHSQVRNRQRTDKAQTERVAIAKLLADLKSFSGTLEGLSAVAPRYSEDGLVKTTVRSNAKPAVYRIFVEQVASSHSFTLRLKDGDVEPSGMFSFKQGGKDFSIDLSTIDRNGDGQNTLEELALAINAAADNSGVVAHTARHDGEMLLFMESSEVGTSNSFSVSVSSPANALATALVDAHVINANNAKIRLDGEQGVLLESSGNGFKELFLGVDLDVVKAQKPGDPPLRIEVGPANMSVRETTDGFLSKVNELLASIKALVYSNVGEPAAPLGTDSTARSIASQIKYLLSADYSGKSLASYGVMTNLSGSGDGGLTVKYPQGIADDPAGFNLLMTGKGNLMDSLTAMLNANSGRANDPIGTKLSSLDQDLGSLTQERAAIEARYDTQYKYYLKKYTDMAIRIQSYENTMMLFNRQSGIA